MFKKIVYYFLVLVLLLFIGFLGGNYYSRSEILELRDANNRITVDLATAREIINNTTNKLYSVQTELERLRKLNVAATSQAQDINTDLTAAIELVRQLNK